MPEDHEKLIRKCYDLARSAVRKGNHPFGALLAREGEVVLTAENTVNTEHDCTRHAELNLVSRAVRELDPDALVTCVLYTSTEPCVMCTGAIYWAGIQTVVYGCSAETLARIAGGSFVFSCWEILARGERPTRVIGPILEEEGARIHESFWK